MEGRRKYPVGKSDFPQVRQGNYLYIDKTEYVYRMTHSDYDYVFLSRPRRFGKSMLVSTLQCYFEARKELFAGLAMERLEGEWQQYPVLRFDMSKARSTDLSNVEAMIDRQLRGYEQIYGSDEKDVKFNSRLEGLVTRAFRQTGKRVVVLVDEYDSPLLNVLHDEAKLAAVRGVMQNFYSPLKGCGEYIRFCFLTGITKFSQLSIFSALNNIKNISMMPEYAGICGITKEELTTDMRQDIELLADKIKKPFVETLDKLVEYYDGYHFASESPDTFNPYSLLNAFSDGAIKAYWFETATPTFLIEMLRKYNVMPARVGREEDVLESSFDAPSERMESITPLMYQSGYSTIKSYDPDTQSYTLDIPNKEIRIGLMESLLPYYIQLPAQNGTTAAVRMYKALRRDDMDGSLRELQKFLASMPYTCGTGCEGHYQQVLYIIFTLMGMFCDVEVHASRGRVDLVMRTLSKLYIIELKMNRDAETAMAQIDLKDYDARFYNSGLPRVKVGVNFDQERRNITSWLVEPARAD